MRVPDENSDRFVRALRDTRAVLATDASHVTSGLVEIAQRTPRPVKAALVGTAVGIAGAAFLRKKDLLKSGFIIGSLFAVGSLMIDSASLSGSLPSRADAVKA